MLTNMKTKGNEELNAEQVAYAKFNQWCLDESAKLGKEIKKNKAEIESLTEEMNKLEAQAAELKDQVAQLTADVSTHEADMKKATAERASDRKAALAEEKDYSESVDALGRAISVLKAQDVDRTGASSALAQLGAKDRIPVKVRSVITAFLSMMSASRGTADGGGDGLDYKAPEAYGYEFQSSSILDMLEKLEDEFRSKLGECQKEELNSQHAHRTIMLDLKDAKENAQRDIADKTAQAQRKLKAAADDKKQLSATGAVMEANKKTLKGMTAECFEKDLSFQEKQKLRKEEIEALGKAVEIMSSPEVAGAAGQHLSLAQLPARGGVALVQASRSAAEAGRGVRRRVREFLRKEGGRLKSKSLVLLADKMLTDPFAKVKKLIDGMITRLLEEAKEDADHEGFCDEEMGKSRVTRTRLQEDIDALDAAVEDGKASILALTESTGELTKEVAELVAAMKEAGEIRDNEKKANAHTVEDAKAAQEAVSAAKVVLEEFYKKAATATAFVQVRNSNPEFALKTGIKMGSDEWASLANPDYKGSYDTGHKEGLQTFGEKETGEVRDEAEYGVLALMEVILSDFGKVEATTKASEAESQKMYEEFIIESKKKPGQEGEEHRNERLGQGCR